MAQAIKAAQVTPADDLRALLDINEKRVVNLPGSGATAVDLLCDLDRIAELWPALAAQGVDLRPEAGRWETLQALVRRHARALVREAQAVGGLRAARAQQQFTGEAPWWWTLDEQVRAHDTRRVTRLAGAAALVVLVVVGGYFLLRVLFPVDPNFQAAQEAVFAGEAKITNQGDFAGAADDFRRAAVRTPEDAEVWLRLGAALQKMGDTAGARDAFQRAEALVATDVDVRLARAPIYLAFNMLDEAAADLQVITAVAPENPLGYFYQASIFEMRQQYSEAVAALQRASELADESKDPQLVVMIRYRLGVLIQQAQMQAVTPATPAP